MRRPDDDDEPARQRLSALGVARRGGWVPDQSAYRFTDEPAESPDVAAAGAEPQPAALVGRPRPATGGAAQGWWPAWLDRWTVAASGRSLATLAAICACCLVVTGWSLLRPRPAPPPAAASAPLPVAALPTPTPAGIVVDVGGRVRRPGLVTLPTGARVSDAVRAAGGAVRRHDLLLVNLAAKVSDGQLLLIGVPGGDGAASGTPDGAGAPVNLNSATVDELDGLPGIGPVLAQRIVDWRSANGGFKSVRDLDQVSGIGDSIFAELSPLVTV